MTKTRLTLVLIFLTGSLFAQQSVIHCGSEMIRNQYMANDPEFRRNQEELELFTQNFIKNQARSKQTRGTIYRIPVVVHVIHNGESIGSGANISVNQINSQITVLNKDFRLFNTDSLMPSHPYWALTDDCEIEFCLATLDPTGNFTTGITRTDEGQPDYDFADIDNVIKPNTIWDREKYLNIWVCKLGGSASGVLGYATPPGSFPSEDGVVIRTISFGTTGNISAPYHKGRTATHEIGHYFNLRHIWGDDGSACTGSDQVSDTPNQASENFGCPSFPSVTCSNGPNGDMYMNFMDYVDDACMKMFTTGQKTRIRATLATGAPRNPLISSKGCTWPVGIQEVASNSGISIFPNPSANHFYIKNEANFAKNVSVSIFNALGQDCSSGIIVNKDAENRFYINARNLPNGTYYVKVKNDDQQFTKTITIIK